MAAISLKVGDSVVVKPNTQDPDFEVNIGGWQGRIAEVDEENNLIGIQWDSITLKQIPETMINQCEEEGMDWSEMYLYPTEVVLTEPRDSEDDVEAAQDEIDAAHGWSYLGEQGKNIQAILDTAEDDSELAEFEAWNDHLERVLKFPFEAVVSEPQDNRMLNVGDKVMVAGLEGVDETYGVLVTGSQGRKKLVFPLCDLDVEDAASANHQPVYDYSVWFANRF
jgi:hypothetical protein